MYTYTCNLPPSLFGPPRACMISVRGSTKWTLCRLTTIRTIIIHV